MRKIRQQGRFWRAGGRIILGALVGGSLAHAVVESKVGGFKYPDGSVQTSAAAAALRVVSAITANTTAQVAYAYLANSTSRLVVTLPATCAVGDQVQVSGINTGGWQVNANSGQNVIDAVGNAGLTGGSIQSVNPKDTIVLTCAQANLTWIVTAETNRHYATPMLATYGATRYWSDGTIATSCKSYRTPAGGYAYAGATGDGTYRINPGGSAYDVYCDMTTDGGGWTLNLTGEGNSNLNTTSSQFTNATIHAGATEIMTYYAAGTSGYPAASPKYKFGKPSGFDPFTVPADTASSLTVTHLASGVTTTNSSVVYGYQNFAVITCDAWDTSSPYGRFGLCIGAGNGTYFDDFPFYNGYNDGDGDFCSVSNRGFGDIVCAPSRFIVMFER